MTDKKNKEVELDLCRMNRNYAALLEKEYKFKSTKSINCRELMKNFNLECLKLNYLLKRDSH